jgi:predicted DNA-binding protein (MmcQ/YjbR family)
MNIEEIQNLCNQLPGVTEDVKWGSDLCFSVGGKMFLVTGLEQSPVTASFKVTAEQFDEMSARQGFKPAPYMAKHKWIYLNDISLMNKREWKLCINQAYELVKQKLPKKLQEQLKPKN